MLVLYHHWSSVCAQKVRFALSEKKVAWESRHVDLFKFENWEPDYTRLNPKGVVPTLVHDDRVIVESNVILEYLDDAFPAVPLRPAEAHARAVMRLWLKQTDEVAHPAVVTASFNLRHLPRWKNHSSEQLQAIAARHPDPGAREAWVAKFRDGVSKASEDKAYADLAGLVHRMERQLAAMPWLAGEQMSLADIALAPYMNRIEVLAHPEVIQPGASPRVAEWWERVRANASYREAMAFKSPDPNDPIAR